MMNTKREVTVGLSISVTGSFSVQGKQALDGIRLWESTANSQGEMTVRLICYDDESRVSRARQNVLKLLGEDRVDILLGPYSSALTIAVAQIAEDRRKILRNHGGSSDEIFNRGHYYLVSSISPARDYLRGLPGWLAQRLPSLRRICVVYSTKGTFASHVARGVVEAAESSGSHSVELVPIESPLCDVDATLKRIHSIEPYVLVLAASFQEELGLMRTRSVWPQSVKEFAAVAAGIRSFYGELGRDAEGVIGPSQWEPEGESDSFVCGFQHRFHQLPEYTAAGGFAIGLILTECIRRAGSLHDERLREVAGELDFKTFYGRFRIDPKTGTQIGHQILLVQWREGRKVVLDRGVDR